MDAMVTFVAFAESFGGNWSGAAAVCCRSDQNPGQQATRAQQEAAGSLPWRPGGLPCRHHHRLRGRRGQERRPVVRVVDAVVVIAEGRVHAAPLQGLDPSCSDPSRTPESERPQLPRPARPGTSEQGLGRYSTVMSQSDPGQGTKRAREEIGKSCSASELTGGGGGSSVIFRALKKHGVELAASNDAGVPPAGPPRAVPVRDLDEKRRRSISASAPSTPSRNEAVKQEELVDGRVHYKVRGGAVGVAAGAWRLFGLGY